MTEKEQKDQLEAYAKEKFGVDLDKRKKLETLQDEVAELESLEEETKPTASGIAERMTEINKELRGALAGDAAMNALALRIWEGQSVSLPVHVRVKRIAASLRDKGYCDLSALTLPTNEDIKRWL